MQSRGLKELLPVECKGHCQPCSCEVFPACLALILQRNGLIPCVDQRKKFTTSLPVCTSWGQTQSLGRSFWRAKAGSALVEFQQLLWWMDWAGICCQSSVAPWHCCGCRGLALAFPPMQPVKNNPGRGERLNELVKTSLKCRFPRWEGGCVWAPGN